MIDFLTDWRVSTLIVVALAYTNYQEGDTVLLSVNIVTIALLLAATFFNYRSVHGRRN